MQTYCLVTAVVVVATGGAAVWNSATEEEEDGNINGGWHFVMSQQNSNFPPQVGLQHLDKIREHKSRQNADNFENLTTADL